MFFEVRKYASIDAERTESDKQGALSKAADIRAQIMGHALLTGRNMEEAREEADAAYEKAAANFPTWFEVDPAVMFPAAIEYLKEALTRLVGLCSLSEGDLLKKAFSGDDEAKFIAQSAGRAMIFEVRDALAGAGGLSWDLALAPRSEFADEDPLVQDRAALLEAVRRFWTEANHQSINNSTQGIHISKDEDWKL